MAYHMTESELLAFAILEKAFKSDELWSYVFEIQDRYADDLDQLDIDNPEMADYLQDVIPEFTESYDNTKKKQWLNELRQIIDHAKTFIKD
ncbi:hypothetical protein [Weissella bombi]|uniref:hypothetical protein n=1 Tax=Weissella bombi TaxID=1505725 RepID=UPI003AF2E8A5